MSSPPTALFLLVIWLTGYRAQTLGWDLWFESEWTEIKHPIEVEVAGRVPAWLRGSLLRTGSGGYCNSQISEA